MRLLPQRRGCWDAAPLPRLRGKPRKVTARSVSIISKTEVTLTSGWAMTLIFVGDEKTAPPASSQKHRTERGRAHSDGLRVMTASVLPARAAAGGGARARAGGGGGARGPRRR